MKLKIKRSQKSGITGKVIFILDVMAHLEPDEQELIKKYKLSNVSVYSNEQANANMAGAEAGSWKALGGVVMDRVMERAFTVSDLVNGQHMECKELPDLMAAEHQVREACTQLARYLAVAATFDGSEELVPITA